MNAAPTRLRTLLRALLLTLVVAAFAIDAARAARPAGSMQIDCGHRYISQVDASRLFASNNVSQAYAKRRTLYARLARTCADRQGVVILLMPIERTRVWPVRAR